MAVEERLAVHSMSCLKAAGPSCFPQIFHSGNPSEGSACPGILCTAKRFSTAIGCASLSARANSGPSDVANGMLPLLLIALCAPLPVVQPAVCLVSPQRVLSTSRAGQQPVRPLKTLSCPYCIVADGEGKAALSSSEMGRIFQPSWAASCRRYFTRITLLGMVSGKLGKDFKGTPRRSSVYEGPAGPLLTSQEFVEEVQLQENRSKKKEYKIGIKQIEAGVVIDHIGTGRSMGEIWDQIDKIHNIMRLYVVSSHGVYDSSSKGGTTTCKGIISIPGQETWARPDLKRLAAIAPGCTLNIVQVCSAVCPHESIQKCCTRGDFFFKGRGWGGRDCPQVDGRLLGLFRGSGTKCIASTHLRHWKQVRWTAGHVCNLLFWRDSPFFSSLKCVLRKVHPVQDIAGVWIRSI